MYYGKKKNKPQQAQKQATKKPKTILKAWFCFVTSQMTRIRGWVDTFDQLTQAIPFAPKTSPQIL